MPSRARPAARRTSAANSRCSPWFPPGVVAGDVSLANVEGSDEPLMFRAKRLAIQPFFWRVVRGQMAFRRFEADGLDLLLETDERNVGNWQFESTRPRKDERKPDADFEILVQAARAARLETACSRARARDGTDARGPQRGVGQGRYDATAAHRRRYVPEAAVLARRTFRSADHDQRQRSQRRPRRRCARWRHPSARRGRAARRHHDARRHRRPEAYGPEPRRPVPAHRHSAAGVRALRALRRARLEGPHHRLEEIQRQGGRQ